MDILKANSVLKRTAAVLLAEENDELANINPAVEAFDEYLFSTVSSAIEEFGLGEDDVFDMLDEFLSELEDSGLIDSTPEDDDSSATWFNNWLSKANEVALPGRFIEWINDNVEFE